MPAHRDETALEDEPKAGQEAPSEDAEGEVVSILQSSTITVTCPGLSPSQPFLVHQALLCERSDFFRASCSKQWQSGGDVSVHVPVADPGHLEYYLKSVYGLPEGENDMFKMFDHPRCMDHRNIQLAECVPCTLLRDMLRVINGIDIWILADFLGDVKSRDKAVDGLCQANIKLVERILFDNA